MQEWINAALVLLFLLPVACLGFFGGRGVGVRWFSGYVSTASALLVLAVLTQDLSDIRFN